MWIHIDSSCNYGVIVLWNKKQQDLKIGDIHNRHYNYSGVWKRLANKGKTKVCDRCKR